MERADLDERSKQVEGTPEEPSSVISVPLKIGDEMLGVMTWRRFPESHSPRTSTGHGAVLAACGMALKNSGRFQDIKSKVSAQKNLQHPADPRRGQLQRADTRVLEMLIKDPKLDERQRRYVKVRSRNPRTYPTLSPTSASFETSGIGLRRGADAGGHHPAPARHRERDKDLLLFSDLPLEMQYRRDPPWSWPIRW